MVVIECIGEPTSRRLMYNWFVYILTNWLSIIFFGSSCVLEPFGHSCNPVITAPNFIHLILVVQINKIFVDCNYFFSKIQTLRVWNFSECCNWVDPRQRKPIVLVKEFYKKALMIRKTFYFIGNVYLCHNNLFFFHFLLPS